GQDVSRMAVGDGEQPRWDLARPLPSVRIDVDDRHPAAGNLFHEPSGELDQILVAEVLDGDRLGGGQRLREEAHVAVVCLRTESAGDQRGAKCLLNPPNVEV